MRRVFDLDMSTFSLRWVPIITDVFLNYDYVYKHHIIDYNSKTFISYEDKFVFKFTVLHYLAHNNFNIEWCIIPTVRIFNYFF